MDLPHVDIDLDACISYRSGDYTEWSPPGAISDAFTALSEPDTDGATLWITGGACTRDEIPELVAWLTAVYHATAPKTGVS